VLLLQGSIESIFFGIIVVILVPFLAVRILAVRVAWYWRVVFFFIVRVASFQGSGGFLGAAAFLAGGFFWQSLWALPPRASSTSPTVSAGALGLAPPCAPLHPPLAPPRGFGGLSFACPGPIHGASTSVSSLPSASRC